MKLLWLLLLAGCAIDPDVAEYNRVEWLEIQFKPAIEACKQSGGIIQYAGPYSIRIKRILEKEDWDKLHRSDHASFACARR